jgi:hypothetical protein
MKKKEKEERWKKNANQNRGTKKKNGRKKNQEGGSMKCKLRKLKGK